MVRLVTSRRLEASDQRTPPPNERVLVVEALVSLSESADHPQRRS
jgi:hypothetical protein